MMGVQGNPLYLCAERSGMRDTAFSELKMTMGVGMAFICRTELVER